MDGQTDEVQRLILPTREGRIGPNKINIGAGFA